MQRTVLGRLSVLLNRIAGGDPGESLCARWAATRGEGCLPCRLVALALRDPGHCADELDRWRTWTATRDTLPATWHRNPPQTPTSGSGAPS